jgi:hypothetical protein
MVYATIATHHTTTMSSGATKPLTGIDHELCCCKFDTERYTSTPCQDSPPVTLTLRGKTRQIHDFGPMRIRQPGPDDSDDTDDSDYSGSVAKLAGWDDDGWASSCDITVRARRNIRHILLSHLPWTHRYASKLEVMSRSWFTCSAERNGKIWRFAIDMGACLKGIAAVIGPRAKADLARAQTVVDTIARVTA